ncbi:MAG: hypothetical protein KAV82_06710 [Phycisphaerae bacterium]|nr:hypothetical protein [Phycisphaerae bacterium]
MRDERRRAGFTRHTIPGRRVEPALHWFDLCANPQAALVKRNPLREVYRVTLAHGVFYAKVFTHRGVVATVKRWVLGAPAEREFLLARALSQVGVGVIRVVATGVSASSRQSVLISEEFPGACTLTRLWESLGPKPSQLIEQIAGFVARTHQADVLPHDTHPDNLLVRPGATPGVWDIAYTDLAGTRVGRQVSAQQAARNIAELYQWFRSRSSTTQRIRFLRTYAHQRFGNQREMFRQFVNMVETAAAAHQRRLWAKRDGRICGANAYFARTTLDHNCTAHLVLRCRGETRELNAFQGERTLTQWHRWINQYLPGTGNTSPSKLPGNLSLQCERAVWWRSLWWGLAGSPLRRRFVVAQRLRHRDVPVVCVPALFERRLPGAVTESLLLVHQPAASKPLGDVARRLLNTAAQARQVRLSWDEQHLLRRLLVGTGCLLAGLVRCGVIARQLRMGMFVVVPGADPCQPIICLADFRGIVVRRRPLSASVVWLPVCMLRSCPQGVSRTGYLRFLRAYWHRLPPSLRGGSWKTLWKRIEAMVR